MDDEQPAIPAATLIVMRESAGGPPDLLMVERESSMAFAGGALVFPGGRVDDADHRLAERFGAPGEGARVTAIRETLEESGIAVGLGPVEAFHALELQQALIGGEPFADLVARHDLALELNGLVPFARWKPSFHQTRRFDTIFYLASAPVGEWSPNPQPGECAAAEWIGAAAVLDRVAAGTAGAIFPTKRNLERLARFADFSQAVEDARRYPMDTIVPWVEERGGERHVCIPPDRGYPVTSEPLTSAVRA
ncbi:NUDIX domain-containing protein [Sphingomonas rhizophila]|uniref:NUDIX domain-containing protein n=1 Tax=Sphingomonas rhizophila TaxID=2071607 RepID=A0A7G9S8M1_9SPHN|nr:NUDIX domain-containing protein [Sphingomonas rhizophila]QNN64196.1 NUDIX domain-containing protein [Sphingomonas rhizophila]